MRDSQLNAARGLRHAAPAHLLRLPRAHQHRDQLLGLLPPPSSREALQQRHHRWWLRVRRRRAQGKDQGGVRKESAEGSDPLLAPASGPPVRGLGRSVQSSCVLRGPAPAHKRQQA